MTDVVQAAVDSGPATLIFTLTVAGIIISVLLGVVIYFVRERVKSRQRYEEVLEKRLSSGSETMQQLKVDLEKLHSVFIEYFARVVSEIDFKEYKREHKEEHCKLEKEIDGVRTSFYELKEGLTSIDQKMDAKFESLNNIMKTLVDRG